MCDDMVSGNAVVAAVPPPGRASYGAPRSLQKEIDITLLRPLRRNRRHGRERRARGVPLAGSHRRKKTGIFPAAGHGRVEIPRNGESRPRAAIPRCLRRNHCSDHPPSRMDTRADAERLAALCSGIQPGRYLGQDANDGDNSHDSGRRPPQLLTGPRPLRARSTAARRGRRAAAPEEPRRIGSG